MAARSVWRGFLKLSLVSCPIRMVPATSRANRLSFHNLNRETMHRIEMVPHDSETGEELDRQELVRGYEVEKDRFIVVEDAELEQLQIESSRTIELDSFVEESRIDTMYFEQPYYLAPDGKIGDETFRVIRDAMRQKGRAGLGRVVIAARERQVVVEPRGPGMLMTTLRAADEVRDPAEFLPSDDAELDAELVKLAAHIIAEKEAKFDPDRFEDRYQKALHALVEAKLKGRKLPAPPKDEEAPTAQVVDLMAMLKKSLQKEGAAKPPAGRKPARAAKPAAAAKSAEKKRKRG
jgi:DNA end-binding protein Ku